MTRRPTHWGFALIGLAGVVIGPTARGDGPPEVAGAVVNAEGKPVRGATVVVGFGTPTLNPVDGAVEERRVATTAPDGSFRVDAPPAGDSRSSWQGYALAHKDRLALAGWSGVMASAQGATFRVAPLVLRPARPYSGLVVDLLDAPVVGARVRLMAFVSPEGTRQAPAAAADGTPLAPLVEVATDDVGRFTLPAVPDDCQAALRVEAEGLATAEILFIPDESALAGAPPEPVPAPGRRRDFVGRHPRTARGGTIVLWPGARVEGRVTTALPDVPVAGLTVRILEVAAMPPDTEHETRVDVLAMTGDDGRFAASGLRPGTVRVAVEGLPPDAPWTARPVRELRLEPFATAEARIELIPGVVVEGTLVDADGLRPIFDAPVTGAPGPRGRFASSAWARTDPDGRFRLRLPPGEAALTVPRIPGYRMLRTGVTRDLDLPEAGTVTLPPIELEAIEREAIEPESVEPAARGADAPN